MKEKYITTRKEVKLSGVSTLLGLTDVALLVKGATVPLELVG
jgi:hypothetical protein